MLMKSVKAGRIRWVCMTALGCLICLILVALALEAFQRGCEVVGIGRRANAVLAERVSPRDIPETPAISVKARAGAGCLAIANRERPSPVERGIETNREAGRAPWEMPAGLGVSAEDRRKRHAFFDGLSEEDREFAALIGCELVFSVGEGAEVRGVYGGGLLQEPLRAGLLPAVSAWIRSPGEPASETPREVRTTVQIGETPVEIEAALEPWPETGEARELRYIFVPVEPIYRSLMDKHVGEDQPERWDLPFVRYKANLPGEYPTNSLGFLDEDRPVPKPPGLFRIACIGGSTTEGAEKKNLASQRYPSILEQRLKAEFGGNAVEVANCGTPGKNTLGYLLRLPDYLKLEPDLVILYPGVNDTNAQNALGYFSASGRCLGWARKSAFLRFWAGGLLSPSDENIQRVNQATTLRSLEAMARVFQERGIGVAIGSFAYPDPAKMHYLDRMYFNLNAHFAFRAASLTAYVRSIQLLDEGYERLCADKGLAYVPVMEEMQGQPYYFLDVCHMNDVGITRKAEIFYAYIRDCVAAGLSHRTK
jgi:lysophospholipase L1-like esterase